MKTWFNTYIFTPSFILASLMVFHLISNIFWISLNNAPPPWDEAAHTKGAIEYTYFFSQLLRGNINIDLFRIPFLDPYLPLGKIIAALVMLLTYPDIKIAQFTGTLFFLGSIYIMFALTKRSLHSDWGALLAAVLISFSPHIVDRSHFLSLDLGVLFFYLLSVYFYLQSSHLENKKFSNLFFIALALTVLTKFQGFIYFIPIATYQLIHVVASNQKRIILTNVLLGLLLALLLTIPVITSNLAGLKSYLSIATQSQFSAPANLFEFKTWWYYLQQLPNGFFPLIYAPLILIGVLIFLRHSSQHKLFLIFQSVGIYILLTIIANKGVRFYLPILPSVILMAVSGLVILTKQYKNSRVAILSYIALWGIIMNATLSFSMFPSLKPIFYINYNVVNSYNPQTLPFNKLIFDILSNEENDLVAQTSILFVPNFAEFNLNSMNMYLRLGNINHITASAIPTDILFQHYFQNKSVNIDQAISKYTYFVYSDSDYGEPWFIDLNNDQVDIQLLLQQKIRFEVENGSMDLIASYSLPSGNVVYLAQRTKKL